MRISFVLLAVVTMLSQAMEPVKVAIVDTGIDKADVGKDYLCDNGIYNFSAEHDSIDRIGHGTIMGDIIREVAGKENRGKYCFYIIKYFPQNSQNENFLRALYKIKELNPELVNISGGGMGFNFLEYQELQFAKNTIFVVAAGNDGVLLDRLGVCFYPACYDLPNVIAVGSVDAEGNRSQFSNYGEMVRVWEIGEQVYTGRKKKFIRGTSISTAVHTGKLLRKLIKEKEVNKK